MKLIVLGSSSTGNGYLLHSEKETLILECGMRFSTVKKALKFKISSIVGAVISHEHGDHAKYLKDYAIAGIPILSGEATFKSKTDLVCSSVCKVVYPGKGYKLGNFKIVPFDLCHDVPCLGYLISHPEMGTMVFMTDTFMCEYTFPGLSHMLIEANYADDILIRNIAAGSVYPGMRPRLLSTHMELETCKGIIKANDLSKVMNIVLIHLSSGNSDEARFVREIQQATGQRVYAANKGLTIDFNVTPY